MSLDTDSPLPSEQAADERYRSQDSAAAGTAIPVILWERFGVLLWALAADVLIFRGASFFAVAVFLAVAVGLLLIVHWLRHPSFWALRDSLAPSWRPVVSTMLLFTLILLAARLTWQGNSLLVASAAVVFAAWTLTMSGWLPNVLQTVLVLVLSPVMGASRLRRHEVANHNWNVQKESTGWLALGLPVIAVLVFGGIFILANPDLQAAFSRAASRWADWVNQFLMNVSFWELPFCVLALFVGAGLLRPLLPSVSSPLLKRIFEQAASGVVSSGTTEKLDPQAHSLYSAYRNTLAVLIALFAAYLCFEFKTLWKRDFPPGFYYAGYAHEGAAWLTTALALATLTLSIIFNADIYRDPRIGRLKWLAWIWSAMNGMLALAVFNRLGLYVGYNGMTRMRTVGFFGISLVVIGFLLVIVKIARKESFAWLVHRQLIALVACFVLYGLFPVDYVAHRYNVNQVVSGRIEPAVMIAVKPISDEGYLTLLDLTEVDDPIVREGVLAMLAQRQREIEAYSWDRPWRWYRYQGVKALLYQRLDEQKGKWSKYLDDARQRRSAIASLKNYAMQWY